MGRGRYTMSKGSIYYGKGGRYAMGRGGRYTMGRGSIYHW